MQLFIYKTIILIKRSNKAIQKVVNLTMWPFDVTQDRPKAQQQFDICYENWRVWPIIHWSDDWCPFCTRDTNCSFPTAWQYHQQQLLPQRMNHGEPINLTDPHAPTHNSTPLQHTLIFRTNHWYVFGVLASLSDFLNAFLFFSCIYLYLVCVAQCLLILLRCDHLRNIPTINSDITSKDNTRWSFKACKLIL